MPRNPGNPVNRVVLVSSVSPELTVAFVASVVDPDSPTTIDVSVSASPVFSVDFVIVYRITYFWFSS